MTIALGVKLLMILYCDDDLGVERKEKKKRPEDGKMETICISQAAIPQGLCAFAVGTSPE